MTEELNRTWPSIASTDVSRQDVRLAHKGFSVSAARSQFEQLSCARYKIINIEQNVSFIALHGKKWLTKINYLMSGLCIREA